MRKILTTLVAAVTIGAATLAMSSSANAWRGGGWGWGWGLGGFAVGALIGSALAAPYYYPYGYYGNYGYGNLRLRQLRLLQLRLRPIPLLRTWLLWLPAGMERVGVGLCLLLIDP